MTSFLDKLNLSPQERKLVIGVIIVLFIVFNVVFVLPYYGELGRLEKQMDETNKKLATFKREIDKRTTYERQLKELEKTGEGVAAEEQDAVLTREVGNQAALSGLQVVNSTLVAGGSGGRTNMFFQEKAVQLNFQNSGEKDLVDFLYSLGAANTLIRVKTMNLRPEQGRMKLGGQITLVKSFQRKQAAKAAAPAVTPVTRPAPAPASPPAKTPLPPTTNKPPETKKAETPPALKKVEPTKKPEPPAAPAVPARAVPTPIRPPVAPTNHLPKAVK